MKAVSLQQPGVMHLTDVAEPEVGPEDVLVEVRCVGLCGSDLNSYRGRMPMVTYPRIPGHEVAGVIAAKGERVPDGVKVGARVMVSPYSNCGRCPACRAGRPNCCQFNQTLGVQRDGALTERIAASYGDVFESAKLSFEELALVEPLSVGYHAANRARVSRQDTVAVIGCGTIGVGAIAAAAHKGATVIAVDIDPAKLERALGLGAHHAVDSAAGDIVSRIAEKTGSGEVNVCIEAVGRLETYGLALELASFAGRVACIGYGTAPVALDTKTLVSKELDLLGSRNALDVFPDVIRMLEARDRPFPDLITCIRPFGETGQALADWDAAPGAYSKILIRL